MKCRKSGREPAGGHKRTLTNEAQSVYGFHRIPNYGFLANGHRAEKLALCRRLLAAPAPEPTQPMDYRERYVRLSGRSPDICSCRGGHMLSIGPLPRSIPPVPFWVDSS